MVLHGEGSKIVVRGKGREEIVDVLHNVDPSLIQVAEFPHNNIQSIECVLNLSRLSELILSDNNIKSLSGIQTLVNLTRLELGSNKIEDFDELHRLRKLEILDISYNVITSFTPISRLKSTCVVLRYLRLQGNPGSKSHDTLSRLVGFTALTSLSVGVTSIKERLYLIQCNPLLDALDGEQVTASEREEAVSMNPLDSLRVEDIAPVAVHHPDLTSINQVNSQLTTLQNELASCQSRIAHYESEKRDYSEFVSRNVKKLNEYIEKSKRERESERLSSERTKASLEQQVRELHEECHRLQQDRVTAENAHRKHISSVEAVREETSERILDLESKLKNSEIQRDSLETTARSLRGNIEALNQSVRNLTRYSKNLSRYISELLNICTTSFEQRRITVATIASMQIRCEGIMDDLSVTDGAIGEWKKAGEKIRSDMRQSLNYSEIETANLKNQMEDLRKEYAISVSQIDDSVRRKILKHEQALMKLNCMYESEKLARTQLEAQVDGFIKREAELRDAVDRTTEETENRIRKIQHELEHERVNFEAEADAKLESLQRKLEAREKDLADVTDTLDRMRTSLRVKEEVCADLSSQVRDLKSQVAILEDERNSACNAQRETFKRELEGNERETAYLKRQLEEAESTIQQKEQLVQYVSSEISGIKEAYEAKLSTQEATHAGEVSKLKQKLGDAAGALLQLDKLVKERDNEKECLRLKLDVAMEDKARLEKLNSQKISQIKCILGETIS